MQRRQIAIRIARLPDFILRQQARYPCGARSMDRQKTVSDAQDAGKGPDQIVITLASREDTGYLSRCCAEGCRHHLLCMELSSRCDQADSYSLLQTGLMPLRTSTRGAWQELLLF